MSCVYSLVKSKCNSQAYRKYSLSHTRERGFNSGRMNVV